MKLRIAAVIFLLIVFFLIGVFFYASDNVPMKWVAILGVALYVGAKIGQAISSGNRNIFRFFSILTKNGLLMLIGSLMLKALLIAKKKSGSQEFMYRELRR